MVLLRFDELNAWRESLELYTYTDSDGNKRFNKDTDDIIDELLDLYLLAYADGVTAANMSLDTDIPINDKEIENAIYKRVAGKNFVDRINEYAPVGDIDGIMRVAETDTTRIYNDGVLNTGKASGKSVLKRWNTMLDDRVRDTHAYLEGMTVPIDGRFYTYDGDSARYPCDFELAENNCNCRCAIELVDA